MEVSPIHLTGRHKEADGATNRGMSLNVTVHGLQGARGRGYCFEGVSWAALAAVSALERGLVGRFETGSKYWAGAGASVALLASSVADEIAHCAQRGKMLLPALQAVLFVFNRIPGEEDEDEAYKLEAGCQAEVDEAEGSDVILRA